MATTNFIPSVLRTLPHDGWLLFVTRFARLFAYGSLSVVLVFYLVGLGLTEAQAGLVLTLTLVGDVVVSLYLTTSGSYRAAAHVDCWLNPHGRCGVGFRMYQ
jgi:hypothetical protein